LLSAADFESLQRKVQGVTRARMLRELAEALEALTTTTPLVLVIEDLHWSNPSTLDALSFLARRRQPARLLILGTYRPMEILRNGHPLKPVSHELLAHNLCVELPLPLLTEAAITTYLHTRFPRSVFPERLGSTLYQRTEGHPFFLVNIVTDWVTQGVLLEQEGTWTLHQDFDTPLSSVPRNVHHLLTLQQDRLTLEDRRLLQAASIGGVEFTTALVAAALEEEATVVADRCATLVEHQQFLRRAGITTWPDGTRAARYRFVHALYHQIWHEEVGIERLQQWQHRLGEREEQAYGARATEIAAELALRFEQAGDYSKAIFYLEQAGKNALQRSANQEAIQHLTKALALL
jgi:predicted ATPase